MTSIAAYDSFSAADHSRELRKAVIAATVGTTTEWYDFFLYGTAAGLVFGKLYFPNSDPTTATLLAFSTYFVGFAARPIGAAIFGHYGDRIGRKATLIVTLMLMGIATFLIAFVPTYELDWDLGRHHPDRAACNSGDRRRRRMGRLGAVVDGMVAQRPPQPRLPRLLAAIWRARGLIPVDHRHARRYCLVWRSVPRLGLADPVLPEHHSDRDRPLDSARHPRDAGIPEARRPKQDRARTHCRGHQEAAERGLSLRAAAHGSAVAVLHLHRVCVRLWRRHSAHVAGLHPQRRVGRLVHFVDLDSALRPHLGPHRSEKDVPHRHGNMWAVRLPLFRHAGHRRFRGRCSSPSWCLSSRTI